MTDEQIRDEIQRAISEERVMLFMNGTPDMPRRMRVRRSPKAPAVSWRASMANGMTTTVPTPPARMASRTGRPIGATKAAFWREPAAPSLAGLVTIPRREAAATATATADVVRRTTAVQTNACWRMLATL